VFSRLDYTGPSARREANKTRRDGFSVASTKSDNTTFIVIAIAIVIVIVIVIVITHVGKYSATTALQQRYNSATTALQQLSDSSPTSYNDKPSIHFVASSTPWSTFSAFVPWPMAVGAPGLPPALPPTMGVTAAAHFGPSAPFALKGCDGSALFVHCVCWWEWEWTYL
jgi:hypothetical protein